MKKKTYIILSVLSFMLFANSITISAQDEVIIATVPSAFSPNVDEKNDVLLVDGGPFAEFDFKIYNRWGEEVGKSTDQSIGWDGSKDGTDLPNGVYVYVLNIKTVEGEEHKLTGNVTLIR